MTISLSLKKVLIAGGGKEQGRMSSEAFILETDGKTKRIQNCELAFTSSGIHVSASKTCPVAKFLAKDEQDALHLMSFDLRTNTFDVLQTFARQ